MTAPQPPITQCPKCGNWDRTTACKYCGIKKVFQDIAVSAAMVAGSFAFLYFEVIVGWLR